MKRLSTLAIILVLLSSLTALLPVAGGGFVTDPNDCPAGTTALEIGDGLYDCIDDPIVPTDPCLSGADPCLPPDPCLTIADPCLPPDPCLATADPCLPGETVNPPAVTGKSPAKVTHPGEGISFNDSDLGVSLFVSQDANGQPMLQVYEMLNQGSNGSFAMTITQDDLAPFVNAPPSANTLLKAQGHVRIFVLTTGEIAILVGPDSEGKIHVKIFDGIPWSKVYGYTIDPQ